MSLRIVHYNDPILRTKGARITQFDEALARLARDMIETMHEAAGIGLAAQQVGRALQLCVVDLRIAEAEFDWTLDGARPPLDLFMPMVIVNPKLTVNAVPETSHEEGCLSFPGIRGTVNRRESLALAYHDEHGVPHTLACDGLFARCILHEVDHLNGVLFIDHMDKKTRASIDEAVKTLARETRDSAEKSGANS